MTEAAAKVELRPETCWRMPRTSPRLTLLSNRHCEEISRSYGGTAVPNAMHNSEGRDHRGIRFRPLDHRLRPWRPLHGDRSSAGEGRRRGVLRISARARKRHRHYDRVRSHGQVFLARVPSRFRQGAGIHICCKERGMTSWQQWLQHLERS
jgi:hypothetical protein